MHVFVLGSQNVPSLHLQTGGRVHKQGNRGWFSMQLAWTSARLHVCLVRRCPAFQIRRYPCEIVAATGIPRALQSKSKSHAAGGAQLHARTHSIPSHLWRQLSVHAILLADVCGPVVVLVHHAIWSAVRAESIGIMAGKGLMGNLSRVCGRASVGPLGRYGAAALNLLHGHYLTGLK